MTNSADRDKLASAEPTDLDLHFFAKQGIALVKALFFQSESIDIFLICPRKH